MLWSRRLIGQQKLNMDPVVFRKQNHFRAGDILHTSIEVLISQFMFPDKPAPAQKVQKESLDPCLMRAAELIGWKKKWKGWGKPVAVEGTRRRGIGVAIAQHFSGASIIGTTGAVVIVNSDGTATLTLGAGRMGQGADTTQCQIVAEVLGIPFNSVGFVEPETLHTPEAPATVGSVTASFASPATKAAAEDAKRKILEAAAIHLDANPKELEIKEGRIFVRANPERGMGFAECVSRPLFDIQCPQTSLAVQVWAFPGRKGQG